MARGQLRIYLGAAPGVGKTYAMLNEGNRRAERGEHVVIGYVETHGRPQTVSQLGDLPIVPRSALEHRGAVLEEMDAAAIIATRPQLVLVDELAHTNVPGSKNEKRWQDVEDIRDAGISVISTVNVQHLESLNDVVFQITGVRQRETVPDVVVRSADQIELVDMSPEALRRRMAHGNIYKSDKIDAALTNYFREGNLGALRELALLWVADRVEEALRSYLHDHGIEGTWETRERVVVALTGVPGGDLLIRRAARMADRLRGELIGVHIARADGLASYEGSELLTHRQLLVELGGTYRELVSDDIGTALAAFVKTERASQLVIGSSNQSRLSEAWRGSVISSTLRSLVDVDVHVFSSGRTAQPIRQRHSPKIANSISGTRQRWGLFGAVFLLPFVSLVCASLRDSLSLSSVTLLYLGVVVGVSAVGGWIPGAAASVVAFALLNWYFTPPIHRWSISESQDLVALIVFLAISLVVSLIVNQSARRSQQANQARAEAEALARSAATLIGSSDPLPELLDQIRASFGLDGVSVLQQTDGGWTVQASTGPDAPTAPGQGSEISLDADGALLLSLSGERFKASEQQALRGFADQLATALQSRELRVDAQRVQDLAEGAALRTALLQAVSHDLRTPLASIKMSATSLLQDDVTWAEQDRHTLLATIDRAADRLDHLVANLLDMSRLSSGQVVLDSQGVALEDVVANVLDSIEAPSNSLVVDVPASLPLVLADPDLLERVLANVISNAIAWSKDDQPVRIHAQQVQNSVHIQVIDNGPGIAVENRVSVFEPFQRLGDRSNDAGVGLGLAVAKGFVDAMKGRIELDDTPDGGLTLTVILPTKAV